MKIPWIIIYILIFSITLKFRIIRTIGEESDVCQDPKTTGPDCNESCHDFNEQCNECYKNTSCYSCIEANHYGSECDLVCDYCETCDIGGKCTKCIDDKFYENNCGKSCENCPSGCNINNGICLNDPVDCLDKNHKGDKCDIPCNETNINCNTCNRNGICYSCKENKFYENNCGKSCENCPTGCNIDDGTCLNNPVDCLDLIHKGDRCDILCDNEFENCDTCFRNGTCISCKNFESHSIYCNASCPSHCSLNTNNKTVCTLEGQCRGCQPFYYGQICEKDCYGCVTGCDNEGYCKDFKCNEGKFGLKCDNNCTCDTNSNNDECGKFSGQCLNCRFGYFGKNCGDTCNYKCRTGLCCIFKGKDLNDVNEDMKLILKTNYKYLNIRKNNTLYKIEIDYNYGFPLILFNQNSELIECNISNVSTVNNTENTDLNSLTNNAFSSYNFTNYEINGYLVTNEEIILGEEKKKTFN